jgi:Zn-finger nucleic acid-binding protein
LPIQAAFGRDAQLGAAQRLIEADRVQHQIDAGPEPRAEADGGFPEKVTAFRPEMAVHGKFKQPCPVCGTAVQRIVYANNECNYCPRCQTEGRLLADRALSRLLTKDFPRTIEDLEELVAARARDA